jgi:isoleucyl-tRNA synthetase
MADDASTPPVRDFRETVFLPDTPFPMRGGLPQKEPAILQRWKDADLYRQLRRERQAAGAPLFVLHDGPPYANGAIHIGHAMQKTLKDFVVRSRFLLGYDVDYVPGWDCHGLPIEWKIEERFRAKGRRKDEVPPASSAPNAAPTPRVDGRAVGGVPAPGRHRRLGQPLLHHGLSSEAAIVAEFHRVLESGQVRRGSKPVMWSPVERTALGRRGGRVPRPRLPHDLGEVPRRRPRRPPARARRGRRDAPDARPTPRWRARRW